MPPAEAAAAAPPSNQPPEPHAAAAAELALCSKTGHDFRRGAKLLLLLLLPLPSSAEGNVGMQPFKAESMGFLASPASTDGDGECARPVP